MSLHTHTHTLTRREERAARRPPCPAWLLVSSAALVIAGLAATLAGTALVGTWIMCHAMEVPVRWISREGCCCGWCALITGMLCYAAGRHGR
ncbi:MAG TPA: hypothetical protein PLG21_20075 [Anaerolineae bacterium]|nr:hypothetical protein [Anaerolineae bacterium]